MFLPLFFKNTACMGDIITDTFSLLFLLPYPPVSRDNMLQITSERPTCSTPRTSTVTKSFLQVVLAPIYQSALLFCKTRYHFSRTTFPVENQASNQCCANGWDAYLQFSLPCSSALLCCYTPRYTRASNWLMRDKQN